MYHSTSHRSSHRNSTQAPYTQNPGPPPPGAYGRPQQSQGGYGYQQSAPPQPPGGGADQELYQWFSTVDLDRSGQITVMELQAALVNGQYRRSSTVYEVFMGVHNFRKLDKYFSFIPT